MKEAVGESSMTIITIILVAMAIGMLTFIIINLVGNQGMRGACENAGGNYSGGNCNYNGELCDYDEDEKAYNCG